MAITWRNVSGSNNLSGINQLYSGVNDILKDSINSLKSANQSRVKEQERQFAQNQKLKSEEFMDQLYGNYKDADALQAAIDSGEIQRLRESAGIRLDPSTRGAAANLVDTLRQRDYNTLQLNDKKANLTDLDDRNAYLEAALRGDKAAMEAIELNGSGALETMTRGQEVYRNTLDRQRAEAKRAREQQLYSIAQDYLTNSSSLDSINRSQVTDALSEFGALDDQGNLDWSRVSLEDRPKVEQYLKEAGVNPISDQDLFQRALNSARGVAIDGGDLNYFNEIISGGLETRGQIRTQREQQVDREVKEYVRSLKAENNSYLKEEDIVPSNATLEATNQLAENMGFLSRFDTQDPDDRRAIHEALTTGVVVDKKGTPIRLTPSMVKSAISATDAGGVREALEEFARSDAVRAEYDAYQKIRNRRDALNRRYGLNRTATGAAVEYGTSFADFIAAEQADRDRRGTEVSDGYRQLFLEETLKEAATPRAGRARQIQRNKEPVNFDLLEILREDWRNRVITAQQRKRLNQPTSD